MHRVDIKKGVPGWVLPVVCKVGELLFFLSHVCLFALFSNIHTLQETMDKIEKLAFASDH